MINNSARYLDHRSVFSNVQNDNVAPPGSIIVLAVCMLCHQRLARRRVGEYMYVCTRGSREHSPSLL